MKLVCPGPMTSGEKEPKSDGLPETSQKSPVALVTAGSNDFVVAVSDILTNPEGAGRGNGPSSTGTASQTPGVTVPPLGAYDPAALSAPVGSARRSGSFQPKSNTTGRVAVAAA